MAGRKARHVMGEAKRNRERREAKERAERAEYDRLDLEGWPCGDRRTHYTAHCGKCAGHGQHYMDIEGLKECDQCNGTGECPRCVYGETRPGWKLTETECGDTPPSKLNANRGEFRALD